MTTRFSDQGEAGTSSGFGPLALLGTASVGAGAIHAAAAAAHGDSAQAAVAFQCLAVIQLAWGLWAMVGHRRIGTILGVLTGSAAVGGWIVAQSVGIGFIDGLDTVHEIGWADLTSAGLAAVVAIGSARQLLGSSSRSLRSVAADAPLLRFGGAVVVGVLTFAGIAVAGDHSSGGHSHGGEAAAHQHGGANGPIGGGGHDHGGSGEPAVPPVSYDPEAEASTDRRVDLSGVAGVSAEQQTRAEELVERTLDGLPQWADPATAEAAGFSSIGDGFTGHEHYVNWAFINDDKILDPDFPESLVYDTTGPEKKLVSAMYMLPTGSTLSTVPDIGGRLTQWHIHDNLCFSDGENPRVVGITTSNGTCRAPARKLEPVPMIHVWITAHPCGPFAALEGVAAGQIEPGETQACFSEHSHVGDA